MSRRAPSNKNSDDARIKAGDVEAALSLESQSQQAEELPVFTKKQLDSLAPVGIARSLLFIGLTASAYSACLAISRTSGFDAANANLFQPDPTTTEFEANLCTTPITFTSTGYSLNQEGSRFANNEGTTSTKSLFQIISDSSSLSMALSIKPLKSPGSRDFRPIYYMSYWGYIAFPVEWLNVLTLGLFYIDVIEYPIAVTTATCAMTDVQVLDKLAKFVFDSVNNVKDLSSPNAINIENHKTPLIFIDKGDRPFTERKTTQNGALSVYLHHPSATDEWLSFDVWMEDHRKAWDWPTILLLVTTVLFILAVLGLLSFYILHLKTALCIYWKDEHKQYGQMRYHAQEADITGKRRCSACRKFRKFAKPILRQRRPNEEVRMASLYFALDAVMGDPIANATEFKAGLIATLFSWLVLSGDALALSVVIYFSQGKLKLACEIILGWWYSFLCLRAVVYYSIGYHSFKGGRLFVMALWMLDVCWIMLNVAVLCLWLLFTCCALSLHSNPLLVTVIGTLLAIPAYLAYAAHLIRKSLPKARKVNIRKATMELSHNDVAFEMINTVLIVLLWIFWLVLARLTFAGQGTLSFNLFANSVGPVLAFVRAVKLKSKFPQPEQANLLNVIQFQQMLIARGKEIQAESAA